MAGRSYRDPDQPELKAAFGRRRIAVLRTASVYGILRLALRLVRTRAWRRRAALSVAERVAALPSDRLALDAPVEIRWSDRLVPFIEAQSDHDLAVALGLVHAHLRLAQIELMRCIVWGRLSGVLGPIAVPLDHAVHALDVTRAVPAIAAALPEPTRAWLAAFVAGINHHLASSASPQRRGG